MTGKARSFAVLRMTIKKVILRRFHGRRIWGGFEGFDRAKRCVTMQHRWGVKIMATMEKTLTIRLTPEERLAAEQYAKEKNMSLAQFARESLLEKIEDAYDLEVYTAWLKSRKKTVPFEDFVKECGFSEDEL